jgi:hypothetical protein
MQQPSKKTLKHPGNTLTVRIVWVPYNWSLVSLPPTDGITKK